MFRKLHWLVEQIGADGSSRVTGVYTSIQDLVGKGLQWSDGVNGRQFRLTLVKPDTFDQPLGCWNGACEGLDSDLQAFVHTHEFSEEEVNLLTQAIGGFRS